MKKLILALLVLLSNCKENNVKQNVNSAIDNVIASDTLPPANFSTHGTATINNASWEGRYVTDSLWLDSVKYQSNNQSPFRVLYDFGKYVLKVEKDSTFFLLESEGQLPPGLYAFNYYCASYQKDDTLYITTKSSSEGSELNFTPISKPVLKLYHQNGKIFGTGINYGKKIDNNHLDIDNPEGDTLEFHKIN